MDSTGTIKLNAEYRNDEYRVLCRNGTQSTQLGLIVDADCALATGIVGEVRAPGG